MRLRKTASQRRRQILIPAVNIVVFGAGGVGKSALIKRFLLDRFDEGYEPTIEDDHRRFMERDGNLCDLTIFDMAGTYQFPAMRRHAIHNGNGFLLVYAVDDLESLDEARRLYQEIRLEKATTRNIPIVLVANKCDLLSPSRRVSREQAISSACDWGTSSLLIPIETSAKSNANVTDAFNLLLEQIEESSLGGITPKETTQNLRPRIRKSSWVKLRRSIWAKLTACFNANTNSMLKRSTLKKSLMT